MNSLVINAQEKRNIHHFPIPDNTSERLFYIQRSLNANTIVYDANFDENGMLNQEKPVKVYWIRFEENDAIMELRRIEKWLAFGVEAERLVNENFDFRVHIAALDNRWFYIKQKEKYQCSVFIKQGQKYLALDHIFVNSDPDNYLSVIQSVEVYGGNHNPSTTLIETILM